MREVAQMAQSIEQRTENPPTGDYIPSHHSFFRIRYYFLNLIR